MFIAEKIDPSKYGYRPKGAGFYKETEDDGCITVHWLVLSA